MLQKCDKVNGLEEDTKKNIIELVELKEHLKISIKVIVKPIIIIILLKYATLLALI